MRGNGQDGAQERLPDLVIDLARDFPLDRLLHFPSRAARSLRAAWLFRVEVSAEDAFHHGRWIVRSACLTLAAFGDRLVFDHADEVSRQTIVRISLLHDAGVRVCQDYLPVPWNTGIMGNADFKQNESGSGRSVLARAARIVQDATDVDWSREPLTEYEAEVRRTWLAQQMERGPFGRIEIAELTFGLDDFGSDLQRALDGLFMLAELRAARQQRRSLRSARDQVNARRPHR